MPHWQSGVPSSLPPRASLHHRFKKLWQEPEGRHSTPPFHHHHHPNPYDQSRFQKPLKEYTPLCHLQGTVTHKIPLEYAQNAPQNSPRSPVSHLNPISQIWKLRQAKPSHLPIVASLVSGITRDHRPRFCLSNRGVLPTSGHLGSLTRTCSCPSTQSLIS